MIKAEFGRTHKSQQCILAEMYSKLVIETLGGPDRLRARVDEWIEERNAEGEGFVETNKGFWIPEHTAEDLVSDLSAEKMTWDTFFLGLRVLGVHDAALSLMVTLDDAFGKPKNSRVMFRVKGMPDNLGEEQ